MTAVGIKPKDAQQTHIMTFKVVMGFIEDFLPLTS